MATHKRSYHCFDAIVDDASRKATRQPVPPRSARQETLEDGSSAGGGCSICQSGTQAEAEGAQASPQSDGQQPVHSPKRPTRPEEGAGDGTREHHFHRHSKRIMLVKNSDPSVRRTIVLHRRAVRSLGVFLDEVSELMQCHVRKLCTMEGHKVSRLSSQSLVSVHKNVDDVNLMAVEYQRSNSLEIRVESEKISSDEMYRNVQKCPAYSICATVYHRTGFFNAKLTNKSK